LLSLFAVAALALSPLPQVDQPLPADDVILHPWGIEFTGTDGESKDSEVWIFDAIGFEIAMESDPITIDDCLATAQIACGAAGIKRLYFRSNPVTGETTCEFECNPGTGGGS